MKVAVFAPNLALTMTVESGESDAADVHLHPGGQAFWVARMLSQLGVTAMLCGPVGGETGVALTALMRLWEVDFHPVESPHPSPAVIQDRRSGEREVFAETEGHGLDRHTLDNAYSLFLELALAAGTAVITGQSSAVVPLEAYRRLGHDLSSTEVEVVADLHGPELYAFLEGGRIDILKVSDEDLAQDGTLREDSDRAAIAAVDDLRRHGAVDVVLSRADRPTIARLGGDLYFACTPRLEPADFRGAGDSMTAGLVAGRVRRLEPIDLLRLACAAGAANVTRHGLGSGSQELIAQLAEKVDVSVAAPMAGWTSTRARSGRDDQGLRHMSASCPAPARKPRATIPMPAHPSKRSQPRAASTDHGPGPNVLRARAATTRVATYSHPSSGRANTKKPAWRWIDQNATVITVTNPAAARRVASPRRRPVPTATSPKAEARAFIPALRKPTLANHFAVPSRLRA